MSQTTCTCSEAHERPTHHDAGCPVWERYVRDLDALGSITMDWRALHEDVLRLIHAGQTAAEAFKSLPVGKYMRLSPTA